MSISYKDQLKDPRWQKKRLEIFERDKFTCQICLDTEETLQVHHKSYDNGKKAWEYGNDRLITLCETCHKALTAHIKNFGNEAEFDVLKLKNSVTKPLIFIYTRGNLVVSDNVPTNPLTERETKKLVQFLINNWLKNG